MSRRVRLVGGALTIVTLVARGADAQARDWIRGYYLNVPSWSDATLLAPGGLVDGQRFRLMSDHTVGPVTFDVAYEHSLQLSSRSGASAAFLGSAVTSGGGEFANLQWSIEDGDHVRWRHRFDRLSISLAPSGAVQLTAGRQTISWATTLLFTPADPFSPFDPADPFREYRAGVDALRAQFFPNPLTDVDLVLRVADFTDRREVTALGRVRTVWYGWEVAGWGGLLHEDAAVGVSGTGGIGPAALRVEGSMRNDDDGDGLAFRTAIGLDTRVTAFGRDLFIAAEYIHDDFGASSGADIRRVLSSEPVSRGELQVLGRDELALQLAWQAHPLVGTDLLTLWNASDGSVLLAPGGSFSVSNETTARIGLFLGLGREPADATTLRSEYGSAPFSVYVSVSTFF